MGEEVETGRQPALAASLNALRGTLEKIPVEILIAALYPALLPGIVVPEEVSQAVLGALAALRPLVPGEQIQALQMADSCDDQTERLFVLHVALSHTTGDTVWLHHALATGFCALVDAGISVAAPPSLLHISAFLGLAPSSNGGIPYMNLRMAQLLQGTAPRTAIHYAASSMRGGEPMASQLIRCMAAGLDLVPALRDDKPISIETLRLVEKAYAISVQNDSFETVCAHLANIPVREVLAADQASFSPPAGDSHYHVFRNAGQVERRPPISVFMIEDGYISFDLTRLGHTEYYVFDRNKTCLSDLSHGGQPFLMPEPERIDGDLCQIGDLFCGPMNVCHFLLDHLTRINIYDRVCDAPPAILLGENHPRYLKIMERAGLLGRTVIPAARKFSFHAQRLLISSNINPNSGFRHPGHLCAPWAITFLREMLHCPAPAPARRLFVIRNEKEGRSVLNWPEVAQVLKRHGFECVNPSDMTLDEQMACFAGAAQIAAVHGAGLTNIVFAGSGAKVLEIMPPLVATGAYWMLSQGCGHTYHALIADDPELPRPDYANWGHHPEFNARDLIIDPARLDAALTAMSGGALPPPAGLDAGSGQSHDQTRPPQQRMPDKMKLMVVANCHCLPLADAFDLTGVSLEKTDFIDVNFLGEAHMREKVDALYAEPDWRAVSLNLSANFERIETGRLKDVLGARLTTFTNIHFDGLHPDITYVGGMGERVASAIGDYHSKIVLGAYVCGLNWQDCLALFNGNTYEKLGYYQAYADSARTLIHRDESCDVKFARAFLDMARDIPVLYTVNHPTGPVFLALAERLAAALGVDYVAYPPGFFQNHLATANIWPVYDEIAERHSLKYRTPQHYVLAKGNGPRALGREDFVRRSYEAYDRIADRAKLRDITVNMPFFPSFQAIS